jgi:hypothetical protein
VIRRVSLAKCVASSSRRVQVVLHLDVEPGAAAQLADALRADLPAAIASAYALNLAQRSGK